MTDAELRNYWPALGEVVADLRRIGRADVPELLVDAVRAGATSGEILGGVGLVLRRRPALCARLSEPAARAWDAVLADVFRAFPGSRLHHWLGRLIGWGNR